MRLNGFWRGLTATCADCCRLSWRHLTTWQMSNTRAVRRPFFDCCIEKISTKERTMEKIDIDWVIACCAVVLFGLALWVSA